MPKDINQRVWTIPSSSGRRNSIWTPESSGNNNGGSGDLTHDAAATFTGSGFGTKIGHDHRYDDCSGTNVTDIWDYRFPSTGTGPLAYRVPQRSVPIGNPNRSKYMCGSHESNSVNGGTAVMCGVDFTKLLGNYSRWEWLARLDPAWVFSNGGSPAGADNNHKFYGLGNGPGTPYNDGTLQWYAEFRGGSAIAALHSLTGDFQWHVNDDAAGNGIDNWGNNGFYGVQANPFTTWVRRSIVIRWASASTGLFWIECNQTAIANDTEKTDGYTGNSRSEAIEGYAGNYNSNNWRYIQDPYYDRGSNDAALYLTNNAVWASSSTRIIQRWDGAGSWGDTSIVVPKINKGTLSAGTVYPHIRSFASGNQVLSSRVIN